MYVQVKSQIRMSLVESIYESFLKKKEWVIPHISRSHGVMAHIWMSHGTHMNESWHTYEWVMAHVWRSHTTHEWSHDPFIRIFVWMDHVIIHMCGMAPSYVCHDSFIRAPWLIHMCAMTHPHVCYDSFICVPSPVNTCAIDYWFVWHDWFTRVPWLRW